MKHAGALVLLVTTFVACGSGGAGAPTTLTPVTTTEAHAITTGVTDPQSPWPPATRDEIAAWFDPVVEPLGYRVTRAALIHRATYEPDPQGDHLAIYLAPLSDITADEYAADLAGLASVFIPYVFDHWSGLESFDFCQEPFDSAAETPPSLTLIDITRSGAGSVSWTDLDLATLIEYGTRDGIAVWGRTAIRQSAVWQESAAG
jgi:hypothetical protein